MQIYSIFRFCLYPKQGILQKIICFNIYVNVYFYLECSLLEIYTKKVLAAFQQQRPCSDNRFF